MSAASFVLASGSPRRRELLGKAGFAFEVDPADIEEIIEDGEPAVEATVRLAVEKAEAVAARRPDSLPVLAADTTVVLGDRIFGKPVDRDHAISMLSDLAGSTHAVVTGWCVIGPDGSAVAGYSRSAVRFRELSRTEIAAYASIEEPMDKAGAYAVQGVGGKFIAAILGPVDNVIGLPVGQVARALRAKGVVSEGVGG